jgi:hypothetical protein
MKLLFLCLLALGSLVLTGCGDNTEPPPPISTEQITGAAPDVFNGAPAELRQLAADAVAAINGQDFPTAWDKLQELNAREGLTDAQKDFVAQGIASVGAEVQKAEQAGDEAAQKALEFHRANK